MAATRTIRVLCVDDSALMREILAAIVKGQPDFELVGVAADPLRAWEIIQRSPPDVITLDVEMPRMDGLTFLERLMGTRPIPVLMVSSLTEKGCATTLKALELGAVDFVSKPKIDIRRGTMELEGEMVEKIRAAAAARPRARPTHLERLDRRQPAAAALLKSTHKVIAIGASTGGTEALRDVLQTLPADAPGIVIVQHMPETFTRAFAERLDGLCRIRVHEASEGDRVLPGHALIAPGGKHMSVYRSGASYQVHITEDPPVNRHRPSVDVLFNSCARDLGANAVGIILTGMGADGAKGIAAMHRAGAHTIAQDEASCVVFGMPREAIATGCVDEILSLDQIATRALALAAPNA